MLFWNRFRCRKALANPAQHALVLQRVLRRVRCLRRNRDRHETSEAGSALAVALVVAGLSGADHRRGVARRHRALARSVWLGKDRARFGEELPQPICRLSRWPHALLRRRYLYLFAVLRALQPIR